MKGRAGTLLIVVAVLAIGCSNSEEQGHPLASKLIDEAPDGFKKVAGPASGPMDIEAAAAATIAPANEKTPLLEEAGFKFGYSRVWTKGQDAIAALVFEFETAEGAGKHLIFELEEIAGARGSELFPVPKVAGALGYEFRGVERKNFSGVACQGVWFSALERTYMLRACGPDKTDTSLTADLAEKQFNKEHATREAG